MKKAMTVFSVALAISSLSQAAELCGVLGSHAVEPQCTVGIPCPHWVKLQYDLRLQDGRKVDLETSKTEVLQEFGEYLHMNICVEGSQKADKFEVTAITATE